MSNNPTEGKKWWKCHDCDVRWYDVSSVCWCCDTDLVTIDTMSARPHITSQHGMVGL